jgi:hypothetical protein
MSVRYGRAKTFAAVAFCDAAAKRDSIAASADTGDGVELQYAPSLKRGRICHEHGGKQGLRPL